MFSIRDFLQLAKELARLRDRIGRVQDLARDSDSVHSGPHDRSDILNGDAADGDLCERCSGVPALAVDPFVALQAEHGIQFFLGRGVTERTDAHVVRPVVLRIGYFLLAVARSTYDAVVAQQVACVFETHVVLAEVYAVSAELVADLHAVVYDENGTAVAAFLHQDPPDLEKLPPPGPLHPQLYPAASAGQSGARPIQIGHAIVFVCNELEPECVVWNLYHAVNSSLLSTVGGIDDQQ